MFKNSALLLLFLVIILSSACSPSESKIITAIAKTQVAQSLLQPSPTIQPTDPPTNTIQPTNTPEPTFTLTPTLTATPTETLTPTPDLRVIDVDPKTLLLTVEELPKEGKYYLPNSGWISPHRNSELISQMGQEKGRTYLEETSRVDGWWVTYNRGTSTVNLPQEVYSNVVLYKTIDGARLVYDKYSYCTDPTRGPKYGYVLLPNTTTIGDLTQVCILKEMQPNGKNMVNYFLIFIYKNLYQSVRAFGWEYEVNPDAVYDIAENLLTKVKSAPLSDSVTYTP